MATGLPPAPGQPRAAAGTSPFSSRRLPFLTVRPLGPVEEVLALSLSHRSSHYGVWFLVFGLIPLVEVLRHGYGANPPTYEAFWLLGTGLLGLVLGTRNLNDGKLAKPYDVLVGLVFTFVGLVGIVGDFGGHTGQLSTAIEHIGLALGGLYPLVYTFLGLKSLHHGLSAKG